MDVVNLDVVELVDVELVVNVVGLVNQESCESCALWNEYQLVLPARCSYAGSTFEQLIHSPPQDPPNQLSQHNEGCPCGEKVAGGSGQRKCYPAVQCGWWK